ncbi:thiamine phosphate synthase [Marinicaulis aureus]|uniref:Thiamine phosphate synthase n=1 Tax=Hyphococcus aureus TaxID=2666033 RepID=A0ABW1KS92_9PROT
MRAAKLAAAAADLKRRSGVAAPFSLAFLTDQRRVPHPLTVVRAMPRGAAVILRDYGLPHRQGFAAQLKSIARARGLKLIIGADIDLARRIGADGVHVPRWFSPAAPFPENMIVTAACHSMEELQRAKTMGADLALLSPAFVTFSHPGDGAMGAAAFKTLAASSLLPVLALGGVDERNARLLVGPNVAGLAAIGAFLD